MTHVMLNKKRLLRLLFYSNENYYNFPHELNIMLAMITTDISCYLIFQLAPVQQFNVILAAHFFMLSPFQSNLIKN